LLLNTRKTFGRQKPGEARIGPEVRRLGTALLGGEPTTYDMTRRALFSHVTLARLTLLAGLVAASITVPVASVSAVQASHPNHRNVAALGVYAGPANTTGVANFETQIGHKVSYVMDFVNGDSWSTISDPSNLSTWSAAGYKTIWGVPMLPNFGGSLAKGAKGAYDSHYLSLARALVAAGQGSDIIRIGWEFNGIWFPWSAVNKASQFVQYYRNIVTAMRSVPGANFTFEWNPSRGDNGAGNLAQYWPGNKYVNYVGLDMFDVEWKTFPGQPAEFQQMLTESYGLNWLAQFAGTHHKPMVIPELGLGWGKCSTSGGPESGSGAVCGGDDGVYVKKMSHWINTHNVFETTFWDYGSSTVTNKADTLTALRTAWGA
jgi:hypothetical protein